MTQSFRLHIAMATPLLSPGTTVTHSGKLIRAVVTLAKLLLGVFEDDTVCVLQWMCVSVWPHYVYRNNSVCVGWGVRVCKDNYRQADAVGQYCSFTASWHSPPLLSQTQLWVGEGFLLNTTHPIPTSAPHQRQVMKY